MGEIEAVSASLTASTDSDGRRRDTVHSAMATSCIWVVPLAGLTAAIAYLLVVFSGFMAEGLDGKVRATTYLIALGVPSVAFAVAAAAGLGAAWLLARWAGQLKPFARVYTWVLGASAALFGAVIAAVTFYAAFAAANWLASF